MRRRSTFGLAMALFAAACAPLGTTTPDAAAPSPISVTQAEPDVTTAPVPVPAGTPIPQNPPPQLGAPEVTLMKGSFPIGTPTGSPARTASTPDLEGRVKFGLQNYLALLDTFRTTGNEQALWAPPKPFRDVVVQSLRATMQPGVVRKFEIVSVRVDAAYVKSWGSTAMVDITTTIRDKVESGNAQTDVETGRLRLAGENRLNVVDGWDAERGRWYNGFIAPSRDAIEGVARDSVANYLWSESWKPATETWSYSTFWGLETPFAKWHDAFVASFDRQKVTTRLFENVSVQVERFDPTSELGDGLAAIRVSGTEVLTDASGATQRNAFDRRVRAFLPWWGLGPGRTVIVDEQSGGSWRAGGDLALKQIDHEFG